jgi:hypothetical protein
VPGGGLSPDGERWIASRGNFLVHVDVLKKMFRGKVIAMLSDAHVNGRLRFSNALAALAEARTFKRFLGPLRHSKWIVYCKPPFAGPEQVLRYLSRYTHRVAISNHRLIVAGDGRVAFRFKDYRIEGAERWKTMTLDASEFIRRFLVHVLPKGLQRIRHYGLFANANRADAIAKARKLLAVPKPAPTREPEASVEADHGPRVWPTPCPCCGKRLFVIEVFGRCAMPRHDTSPPIVPIIRIDTS